MIIVAGPLRDNFHEDELLPRLLKPHNVNKGGSCYFTFAKGCPWIHSHNTHFLQMNCFFAHSFINTIILEIFIQTSIGLGTIVGIGSTETNKNVSLFLRNS